MKGWESRGRIFRYSEYSEPARCHARFYSQSEMDLTGSNRIEYYMFLSNKYMFTRSDQKVIEGKQIESN